MSSYRIGIVGALFAIALLFPALSLHAQTTSSDGQVVCEKVERSVFDSIWGGILAVGEFVLIDAPVGVGKAGVSVVTAVSSAALNTVVDGTEYVYTCAFLFTWPLGMPHPSAVFPNSKTLPPADG